MMNKIIIYTDGACSNNQDANNSIGGWAYLIKYLNHTKKESGQVINTTNNRMELQAVISALSALKRFDLPIEIYSDSNYVVNTYNEGWKPKTNLDLWQQLDNLLVKFEQVTFIKVKGHSCDPDNNLVDQMAVAQTKL